MLLLASVVFPGLPSPRASVNGKLERGVRPLVKQYCFPCHSTEKHKGDIDLEKFSTLSAVLNHPEPWERVYEEVSMDEMPPKEKPQPASADRARLAAWVNNALEKAAQKRAGDPGPVVLRRLNNAEYTCTIRDLTGVESLDPANEFPARTAPLVKVFMIYRQYAGNVPDANHKVLGRRKSNCKPRCSIGGWRSDSPPRRRGAVDGRDPLAGFALFTTRSPCQAGRIC